MLCHIWAGLTLPVALLSAAVTKDVPTAPVVST
jgi:hypothetical protein